MERPVLCAFNLRVVIAQMLLEIAELNEGATALWQVAFVRPLACNKNDEIAEKHNNEELRNLYSSSNIAD
jgi:hypothetical protein